MKPMSVVRKLPYVSVAAGLLLLTACGSSGTSSKSTPSVSASGASGEVAAAQSFIKQYQTRPTKLNVTPLPAAPKPGGVIAYMNSGTAQGAFIYAGMQEAAALVGWKAVSVPFSNANPASLNGALDTALTLSPKPTAVTISGVPQTVWANEIPKYQAAGVAMIPFSNPTPIAGPVKAELQGTLDSTLFGKILANWVTADSNGKGSALVVSWPDLAGFKLIGETAVSNLKSICSGCSATTLNLSLAQLANGANDAIVSSLQSHPDIKYVVASYGQPLLGLDAAMKAAGITGVKVGGSNPALQNLQDLANGATGAWISAPYAAYAYLMVDVALRVAAGVNIPDGDGGQPVVLLTKDNVGTGTLTDAVQEVPDNYKALYAQAWQVSK